MSRKKRINTPTRERTKKGKKTKAMLERGSRERNRAEGDLRGEEEEKGKAWEGVRAERISERGENIVNYPAKNLLYYKQK